MKWWYPHLFKNFPQFAVIYTVKGISIVNETDVDVFLGLSCFFDLRDYPVLKLTEWFSLVVAQSHLTLSDPMDCSKPGFPVHHQLSELTQTHVHRVGDAIQPSHHLSSPSPPSFNLSQHEGLFQ